MAKSAVAEGDAMGGRGKEDAVGFGLAQESLFALVDFMVCGTRSVPV